METRHCGIQTEIQKRLWLTARRLRHVGKKDMALSCMVSSYILEMEAQGSSKMLKYIFQTSWHHTKQDSNFYFFTVSPCISIHYVLVCNKTLIQMSHIKTLKITPTCFDH
jgi:hypothetical protein